MWDPSGLKAAEDTAPLCRRTAISVPLVASQMRAVLSFDAVTTRKPSGLKAADHTSPSCPFRNAIILPLLASKMPASCDAAMARREPSGLKQAECTFAPTLKAVTSIPFPASQMRTLLSSDAVMMCDPSGLKAADDT